MVRAWRSDGCWHAHGQTGRLGFDDEADLDDAIVQDFHFGGGFVPKKPADGQVEGEASEEAAPERRRSKKEVIIPCQLTVAMFAVV